MRPVLLSDTVHTADSFTVHIIIIIIIAVVKKHIINYT